MDIQYVGYSLNLTSEGRSVYISANEDGWRVANQRGHFSDEAVAAIIGAPVEEVRAVRRVHAAMLSAVKNGDGYLAEKMKKADDLAERVADRTHRAEQSLMEDVDFQLLVTQAMRRLAGARKEPCDPEAPIQISEIDGLRRHAESGCCVYFLARDGCVVYVGETICGVETRILQHRRNKVFDNVWILPVPSGMRKAVESRWIERLQPEYNIAGTPREVFRNGRNGRVAEAQPS